ncbi:HAMP domain-containing histidine kinase [Micromonospora sp. R77]|uniref:sensor histidine kinase n=1 Tax=Micromonospora sp. R77 TaxID=2925836 RepID=UPI001F617593|nr:HAMP domain-containing sensor histidine kinase [Micromonospora sp. R77]MCI4061431.1 HAMP domain-containing histidine kinase [Micromonospora sp. R77]
MRSRLVRGALAVTSMVAIAFLVPLALLAGQIAHDRAIADARGETAVVIAAVTVTEDRAVLERVVASTPAGADGRLALHLPDEEPIGVPRAEPADLRLVMDTGQPLTADVPDGVVFLQPSTFAPGRIGVIEVWVPRTELERGVGPARLSMVVLAAVLVASSTVLADRLAAGPVTAARHLAAAARRIGQHDLQARVEPSGPAELAEVGRTFNLMAERLHALLLKERERAADLSHRLRTPMTALRLDAESLAGGTLQQRLIEGIDAIEAEVDAIITAARNPGTAGSAEGCDLAEVVNDRLSFWALPAEHQQRQWQWRGGTTPVPVPVPRAELVSAVDALLGNIFRHTPAGTPFRVTVTARALVVEDGGPGITDADQAVQRGVSGAASSGLGLDIVHRMCTHASGRLEIGRSRELGGARIVLSFPLPPRQTTLDRSSRG